MDRSQLKSTSEESTKISGHSALAGGSRGQGFQSQHCQVRATVLEQELNRRPNETMRLGRYAACMMIDIKYITEAIASIEAHSAVIDKLVVETSKAAQKLAEEKIGLHTRVNDLENSLEALQEILSDTASPH